jgi:sortase A
VLEIPKLGLEVPVFNGTDDLTLNRGVGRDCCAPSERGNVGIAGHRDGFFRGLKDIATGDRIELQTQKRTETYRVSEIRITDPTDVRVLEEQGVPALTLVTCYPFYFIGNAPQRYIVRAVLSNETLDGKAEATPNLASGRPHNQEKTR